MAAADAVLEIDATSLKALAHPIRTRILRILEVRRQVSVTSLAAELRRERPAPPAITCANSHGTGSSSSSRRTTLRRQPAEAAPDARSAGGGWPSTRCTSSGFDYHGTTADTRAAADVRTARRAGSTEPGASTEWYANATQWPAAWQRASSDSDRPPGTRPRPQTRALADELKALLDKYDAMPAGTRGAHGRRRSTPSIPTETGERP